MRPHADIPGSPAQDGALVVQVRVEHDRMALNGPHTFTVESPLLDGPSVQLADLVYAKTSQSGAYKGTDMVHGVLNAALFVTHTPPSRPPSFPTSPSRTTPPTSSGSLNVALTSQNGRASPYPGARPPALDVAAAPAPSQPSHPPAASGSSSASAPAPQPDTPQSPPDPYFTARYGAAGGGAASAKPAANAGAGAGTGNGGGGGTQAGGQRQKQGSGGGQGPGSPDEEPSPGCWLAACFQPRKKYQGGK